MRYTCCIGFIVLVLLTALAAPTQTMKDKQVQSRDHLRQLALATLKYAQANDNVMPPMDTLEHWMASLKIADHTVFQQPGTGEPYQRNAALDGRAFLDIAHKEQTVLVYEQHPWPNGLRGVAFCDGHVDIVAVQRWQQLKTAMAREAGQIKSSKNLRMLAISMLSYAQDNDELMPPMDTFEHWKAALKRYAGANGVHLVFNQPGTGDPYRQNAALSKKAIGEIEHPEQLVLAFEGHPWPDGLRVVVFCDAHVELVNFQRWAHLKASMAQVKR